MAKRPTHSSFPAIRCKLLSTPYTAYLNHHALIHYHADHLSFAVLQRHQIPASTDPSHASCLVPLLAYPQTCIMNNKQKHTQKRAAGQISTCRRHEKSIPASVPHADIHAGSRGNLWSVAGKYLVVIHAASHQGLQPFSCRRYHFSQQRIVYMVTIAVGFFKSFTSFFVSVWRIFN